ncbi:MAG: glutamate mutase L [Chloroflexota bacterium]
MLSVSIDGSILVIGVELDVVRVCWLEPIANASATPPPAGDSAAQLTDRYDGQYRLVGWQQLQNNGQATLLQQIERACLRLGKQMGRPFWDDIHAAPLMEHATTDPVPGNGLATPMFRHVVAAATPQPHLRAWLMGVSPSVSIAAAQQTLASSPTQLVGITHLEQQITPRQLANDIQKANADVLVIVGGYDIASTHATAPLQTLTDRVVEALLRMPPDQHPKLFFAGNRWAAGIVESTLTAANENFDAETVANVLPKPGVLQPSGLVHALSYYHWRLCQRVSGFAQIERWAASGTYLAQINSMEWNFAQLVQAWMRYQNLPYLHGIYRTTNWWLHVWATANQRTVRMVYHNPNRPSEPSGVNLRSRLLPDYQPPLDLAASPSTNVAYWPPAQLISDSLTPHAIAPPSIRGLDRFRSPKTGQPSAQGIVNTTPEIRTADVLWWDRHGLAPAIAAVGQVTPQAMLQVLAADVF